MFLLFLWLRASVTLQFQHSCTTITQQLQHSYTTITTQLRNNYHTLILLYYRFAFAKFYDHEQSKADAFIAKYDGYMYEGRKLNVRLSKPEPPQRDGKQGR